ncbi:Neutral ceramidase [Phytophthora cinnamomi]|uniref:Neutral ceramidase n=1 Tax=Phytophthora cinnamomi TaxID=4785 RepID=UPI00355A8CE9|nr:Neutral ceramidase [Phytophthora cinnamomi]
MPRGVRREESEGSPAEGKTRQRFGRDEDYLLALQVKADAPFKARHGAIGETWDAVAEQLNQHPDFHMRPIKGTTAKTRFDTLVQRHRLWQQSASVEGSEEVDSPYRQIMSELVKEVDERPRTNARHGSEDNAELQAEGEGDAPELRTSSRLGKRRTSSEAVEPEPERREVYVLPRPRSEPEQVQSPVRAYGAEATATSVGTVEVQTPRTPVAAPEPVAAPAVEDPVAGDLVTAQQAMAELLKMQHAFAARPSELRVIELEKMNEARLREEEEKTKQRGLELQIEIQRTKRRQLELEFEREERQKDREEQAKLIASLVQRLEPKRD